MEHLEIHLQHIAMKNRLMTPFTLTSFCLQALFFEKFYRKLYCFDIFSCFFVKFLSSLNIYFFVSPSFCRFGSLFLILLYAFLCSMWLSCLSVRPSISLFYIFLPLSLEISWVALSTIAATISTTKWQNHLSVVIFSSLLFFYKLQLDLLLFFNSNICKCMLYK